MAGIKYFKKDAFKENFFFSEDFVNKKFKPKNFDLIVDSGSLSFMFKITLNKIKKIISLIELYLKNDGLFIGVDLYSKNSSYFKKINKQKLKKIVFHLIKDHFQEWERYHFLVLEDIKNNFKNFNIIDMNEKF